MKAEDFDIYVSDEKVEPAQTDFIQSYWPPAATTLKGTPCWHCKWSTNGRCWRHPYAQGRLLDSVGNHLGECGLDGDSLLFGGIPLDPGEYIIEFRVVGGRNPRGPVSMTFTTDDALLVDRVEATRTGSDEDA